MNEAVALDTNDLLAAITNQRNGALDECAKLYAAVQTLKKEVKTLRAKLPPEPASP